MEEIVSVDWLTKNLKDEHLILLDASFSGPKGNKSSKINNVTIPGARFFDLKSNFSDKSCSFPIRYPLRNNLNRNVKNWALIKTQ